MERQTKILILQDRIAVAFVLALSQLPTSQSPCHQDPRLLEKKCFKPDLVYPHVT